MTRVAAALVVVLVAIGLSRRRRLGLESEIGVSVLRAGVQLSIAALVITTVFEHLALSGLFVLVMLAVASWTAARRWGGVPHAWAWAAASIGSSAGVVLAVVFASGAFELRPQELIPLAGIIIGGSMVASSIAGLRLREEVTDQLATIEARLVLGVSAAEALAPHVRRATVTALVPVIEQTKNVGLVTLPGTFVGMLLGGATPADAAIVQLTVLFVLIGAEAIAALATTALVARALSAPGERVVPS